MPVTSRGVSTRERSSLEEAVEAVFDADRFDAAVGGGLDDGADDGVEAGRVAAAGENADASDRDMRSSVAGGRRVGGALPLRKARVLESEFRGRLAQLGERRVRNAEVTSSSLVSSTIISL